MKYPDSNTHTGYRLYRHLLARYPVYVLFALLALLLNSQNSAASDALDDASQSSHLVRYSLLMDLNKIGDRLLTVGERGHILQSRDQGQSWQQQSSPVRVTLTASHFVDEQQGWAVGHDGVVLRTLDGGQQWSKLLDGHQINRILLDHAKHRVAQIDQRVAQHSNKRANGTDTSSSFAAVSPEEALENAIFQLEDAEAFAEEGPSRPLLDVWFKNPMEGIVVGAFGLMLYTQDGGDSWFADTGRLDNPDGFHLNSINQIGEQLFIAAEAGQLYRSLDWGASWQLLDSPYEGSFFGVVGSEDGRIVAYGLRGHAFLSNDWGDHWQTIKTGVDTSLFGGSLLTDNSLILVGNGGIVLHISPDGHVLKTYHTRNRLPLSQVIPLDQSTLLTVGLAGAQPLALTGGEH